MGFFGGSIPADGDFMEKSREDSAQKCLLGEWKIFRLGFPFGIKSAAAGKERKKSNWDHSRSHLQRGKGRKNPSSWCPASVPEPQLVSGIPDVPETRNEGDQCLRVLGGSSSVLGKLESLQKRQEFLSRQFYPVFFFRLRVFFWPRRVGFGLAFPTCQDSHRDRHRSHRPATPGRGTQCREHGIPASPMASGVDKPPGNALVADGFPLYGHRRALCRRNAEPAPRRATGITWNPKSPYPRGGNGAVSELLRVPLSRCLRRDQTGAAAIPLGTWLWLQSISFRLRSDAPLRRL
ncbi:uncharacterized protein LOC128850023 [Cuculus canorus]|uniref:uncharacterized protein LOC128850023 n=1 Tax=Cuculus canorus TaxID=55661 RepID=UPI0023AB2F59|nr:uncharacterized protein LOC128850023 [Cuculus canorus]